MARLGTGRSLQKEQQLQKMWDRNELVRSEKVEQEDGGDRSRVRWRDAQSWADRGGPWRLWSGFD